MAFFHGVKFEILHGKEEPARFVLSIRKCGSTLLNNVCRNIAAYNKCNYVNIPEAMFDHNVTVSEWIDDPSFRDLVRPGNVYGGFRDFPTGLAAHSPFCDGRKVLLVRDPRDALVSEFFSNAFTHPIPQGEGLVSTHLTAEREAARTQEIEDYVLRHAGGMVGTFAAYLPSLADPNTLVLRYEDIILDKGILIDAVVRHFNWVCPGGLRDAIIRAFHIVPAVENPQRFIRKVVPGDHHAKLAPRAIAELDHLFGDVMDAFGYANH
jgi:hypothetical protein